MHELVLKICYSTVFSHWKRRNFLLGHLFTTFSLIVQQYPSKLTGYLVYNRKSSSAISVIGTHLIAMVYYMGKWQKCNQIDLYHKQVATLICRNEYAKFLPLQSNWKMIELLVDNTFEGNVRAIIYFLIARGKGPPSIHCHVCDNKLVIDTNAYEAMIYLTSLLPYLNETFVIKFAILVVLANSRFVWNVISVW